MANRGIDRLLVAEKPWLLTYSGAPEEAYELAWKLQQGGSQARVIRGSKTTTLDGFFDEIGAALQLPAYFGENWPALDECLKDLSWLRGPAYVLIVTEADSLFRDDEFDSLPTLLKLAASAAEAWAVPADTGKPWGHGSVPFHVVFQVRKAALKEWHRRVGASGHKAPEADLEVAK
jgi:hypothetical protein